MKNLFVRMIISLVLLSFFVPPVFADNLGDLYFYARRVETYGGDINGDGKVNGYDWVLMTQMQKEAMGAAYIIMLHNMRTTLNVNRYKPGTMEVIILLMVQGVDQYYQSRYNRHRDFVLVAPDVLEKYN